MLLDRLDLSRKMDHLLATYLVQEAQTPYTHVKPFHLQLRHMLL